MRIAFTGNRAVAAECLDWLVKIQVEVIHLFLEPCEMRGTLLRSKAPDAQIHEASTINDDLSLFEDLDLLVSVMSNYIITQEVLDVVRGVNLHPALLPFNRGNCPNVWPLIDGTPAGVTLHHIDAGIDTGDIIYQEEVSVLPSDTAETLYDRLLKAMPIAFRKGWSFVGKPGRSQGVGTVHKTEELSLLDLKAEDMPTLNKLRARTFPPYQGARFTKGGKAYHVNVTIEEVDPWR